MWRDGEVFGWMRKVDVLFLKEDDGFPYGLMNEHEFSATSNRD